MHPLIHIGGLVLAMAMSIGMIAMQLDVTLDDVSLLIAFMTISGGISILTIYFFYYTGVFTRFRRLHWTLLTLIGLMAALMFLNIWLTAQAMFINAHDFVLMIALLLFAGMVSSSCVFFIAHLWIARIQQLASAADRLGTGEPQMRLTVQGHDELASLTIAFNRMIDGLSEIEAKKAQLEQTRRDLVAWVSHDLRTPLSTIRAMNEAILDGMVSDAETTRRYIETIQSELKHLSHLIDDLFDLAQLDADKTRLVRETTSLHDLVSDTLSSMSARANKLRITLNGSMDADIDTVLIAPDKIQRVLYNLLDNALNHTPPGGDVTIRVRRIDGAIEIAVCNSGSYIPSNELPNLFDSFYRGDPARAHNGGERGAGLGLAIARGFVEAHGGTIQAHSTTHDGTIFWFTLPI